MKHFLVILLVILFPVLCFAGPTTGTTTGLDVSNGNARINVTYAKDGVEVGQNSFYVANQPALIIEVKQAIAEKAKEYDDAPPVDQDAEDAKKAQEEADRQAKIDALTVKIGDTITAADIKIK